MAWPISSLSFTPMPLLPSFFSRLLSSFTGILLFIASHALLFNKSCFSFLGFKFLDYIICQIRETSTHLPYSLWILLAWSIWVCDFNLFWFCLIESLLLCLVLIGMICYVCSAGWRRYLGMRGLTWALLHLALPCSTSFLVLLSYLPLLSG